MNKTMPEITKLAAMERKLIEDEMTSQLVNCFVGEKNIDDEQREIMEGFIRSVVKEDLDEQCKRFQDELLSGWGTGNLDFLKKYEGEE
jgi:hypothetical protein